jgi:hypothetical protein
MKREAGAIPLSYAYIRRPLIKIGLRAPTAHRVNGSRSRSIKKEDERELCDLNSPRRIRYDWSISKGHSIMETVQSSVSACFSIEILLIIIPVVTIPMIELP